MADNRKNIYFKNGRVRKAVDEADNGSEFVEKCILYYLDSIEKGYITKEEVTGMLDDYDRKVCILNQNYTQVVGVLEEIVKELFK